MLASLNYLESLLSVVVQSVMLQEVLVTLQVSTRCTTNTALTEKAGQHRGSTSF